MMTKVITEAYWPMRIDRRSDTNSSYAVAGVVRFTASDMTMLRQKKP